MRSQCLYHHWGLFMRPRILLYHIPTPLIFPYSKIVCKRIKLETLYGKRYIEFLWMYSLRFMDGIFMNYALQLVNV